MRVPGPSVLPWLIAIAIGLAITLCWLATANAAAGPKHDRVVCVAHPVEAKALSAGCIVDVFGRKICPLGSVQVGSSVLVARDGNRYWGLTNKHVVTFDSQAARPASLSIDLRPFGGNAKTRAALGAVSTKYDLAVFTFESNLDLPVAVFARGEPPDGSEVTLQTYTGGETFFERSSRYRHDVDLGNTDGSAVRSDLQDTAYLDANVRPGDSGGAVLYNGELVGLVYALDVKYPFGLCTDYASTREFMREIGWVPTPAQGVPPAPHGGTVPPAGSGVVNTQAGTNVPPPVPSGVEAPPAGSGGYVQAVVGFGVHWLITTGLAALGLGTGIGGWIGWLVERRVKRRILKRLGFDPNLDIDDVSPYGYQPPPAHAFPAATPPHGVPPAGGGATASRSPYEGGPPYQPPQVHPHEVGGRPRV
ncbi:S1 family peptidase [Stratiformator vulcanicus]|nr:serine protease [Stratiformator vulcanicus]